MKSLLTVLFLVSSVSAFAAQKPCGLYGNVDQRVKDCSVKNAPRAGFILMTRTPDQKEFLIEMDTKTVWGADTDVISSNPSSAREFCANYKPQLGGLNLEWSLPTKETYIQADKSGIRVAIKDMWPYSITGSSQAFPRRAVWVFSSQNGVTTIGVGPYSSVYPRIRCVSYLR